MTKFQLVKREEDMEKLCRYGMSIKKKHIEWLATAGLALNVTELQDTR